MWQSTELGAGRRAGMHCCGLLSTFADCELRVHSASLLNKVNMLLAAVQRVMLIASSFVLCVVLYMV
jgi:hypothetical protein